ncbi:hypothetical protein ACT3R5_09425 [Glutamicibacter sp. AOP5-A2-7]
MGPCLAVVWAMSRAAGCVAGPGQLAEGSIGELPQACDAGDLADSHVLNE